MNRLHNITPPSFTEYFGNDYIGIRSHAKAYRIKK